MAQADFRCGHPACCITRHATDRSRGYSLVVQKLLGRGSAIYEQAVVKLERVGFGGLIPTVYSASRLRRRHFSFCDADLTH
jgi:hypothetical protein